MFPVFFRLRERIDLVLEEEGRIRANAIAEHKSGQKPSLRDRMHSLSSKAFLRPFIFLNIILDLGCEWAGFPILAFYTVNILTVSEPFPYYVNFMMYG